jgi:Spy/CpxP family protein refolding chaperone
VEREAACPRYFKSPPGADSPGELESIMHHHCKPWRHAGHHFGHWGGYDAWSRRGPEEGEEGGGFGIRRPLRFLAHKLELDEGQIGQLARILDELKTERAQGEVDNRRALAAFSDAVAGEAFGEARAKEAGDLRVKTAERLRDAVLKALREIHAVLRPDQRQRLSYLIRTGTLVL